MKINEIKNSVQVKVRVISDIEKYRGFYFALSDGYIVANFCSCVEKGLEAKYSLGFKTNGKSVIEHLYSKIENGLSLTRFEKIAFYEDVNLFNPLVQRAGKWYDFSKILHKVRGLEFYTLSEKISKKEIKLFNETESFVDIEELLCA